MSFEDLKAAARVIEGIEEGRYYWYWLRLDQWQWQSGVVFGGEYEMGNVAEKQYIFGGSLLPDKLGFFFIPENGKFTKRKTSLFEILELTSSITVPKK